MKPLYDNTSSWGRIRLMLRLLWVIHRKNLVNTLGISAAIELVIALFALELNGIHRWAGDFPDTLPDSFVVTSWLWCSYCLSQTVHRLEGVSFVSLPLRLWEKGVALGLYLFGGAVLFRLLGYVLIALLVFIYEGLGSVSIITDWVCGFWEHYADAYRTVYEASKLSLGMVLVIVTLLEVVLGIALAVWCFVRVERYIKAVLVCLIALGGFAIMMAAIGSGIDSLYMWSRRAVVSGSGYMVWLIAFYSALIYFLTKSIASRLQRMEQ